MKKIIITIDGFSGTGKSTIAKKIAQRLGYLYVDTGAMYRAVTYWAMEQGFISQDDAKYNPNSVENIRIDVQKLLSKLQETDLDFRYDATLGVSQMYLNGQNIEDKIRTIEVANKVSHVAKIPQIRSYLVDIQRKIGRNKGIVMDGRDIGTIVFPDAELKIFMTASEEVRAQRRYNELIAKGENVSLEEVLQNIRQRDAIDTSREESPLQKAPDAIVLDNSHTTIDDLVNQILEKAQKHL